jgi:hypothetical protein
VQFVDPITYEPVINRNRVTDQAYRLAWTAASTDGVGAGQFDMSAGEWQERRMAYLTSILTGEDS